jgi:hypothetical protein
MDDLDNVEAKNLSPLVLDDINAFNEMNATIYMERGLKGRTNHSPRFQPWVEERR